MKTYPINLAVTIKLDGSGNGTAKLTPKLGQTWRLTAAAVKSSSSVSVPTCNIYMGATATDDNFVDGTYSGSLDSTGRVAQFPLGQGQSIFAVWAGGDANATATLSIYGEQDTGN